MKKLIISTMTAALGAIALFPTAGIAQDVPTDLRQDMTYAEARQILMNAGWQATYRSPMRERFGAMDYIIDELGYHEVTTCSGTGLGFCSFEFNDAYGNRLSVTTVKNFPRFGEPTLYGWQLEQDSSSNGYRVQSNEAQSIAENTCRYQLKPETNVRTGPSIGSSIITTVRPPLNRDLVMVHSTQTGRDGQSWSWISFNYGGDETPGWVRSDLIVCQ
jgi:hypothetical protein